MTRAEFRLSSGQHVVYDGAGFTFSGSDLTLSRRDLFDLMSQVMAQETAAIEAMGFTRYYPKSGESGGSISAAAAEGSTGQGAGSDALPPDSNKTGGSRDRFVSRSCRDGDHGACGLGVCGCRCHL